MAGFVWANQLMAHWVFPFSAEAGRESRAVASDWKGKSNAERCDREKEKESERDQTTYSDVNLWTVRQTERAVSHWMDQ